MTDAAPDMIVIEARAPGVGEAVGAACRSLLSRTNRSLLWSLVVREVAARYKGSVLGWAWALVAPLAQLAVYVFVFGFVLEARWQFDAATGLGDRPVLGYATMLFCGLVVYGAFAEVCNQSPGLLPGRRNLVKRVAFPLPILPLAIVGAAGLSLLVGLVLVLATVGVASGRIPATAALLPFVLLPHMLLIAGAGWLLSSIGVYAPDVRSAMPVLVQLAMFLSAVFYPVAAVPEPWRAAVEWNPLAITIAQVRRVAVEGLLPETIPMIVSFGFGAVAAVVGLAVFTRLSRGFADVI